MNKENCALKLFDEIILPNSRFYLPLFEVSGVQINLYSLQIFTSTLMFPL